MNTNQLDDFLDESLLEGTTPRTQFTKIASLPDGTSYFRILESPIEGQAHIMQHWYYWFKFATKKEDGTITNQWRTAKAEFVDKDHKNPMQIKLVDVSTKKAKMAAPYTEESIGDGGQIVKRINFEKMPANIRTAYKALAEEERLLKPVRHYFCNAVDAQGNLVVLRMPKRVFEALKELLVKVYKTDPERRNPLSKKSANAGVWIEFNRSGSGKETRYVVAAKTTSKGEGFVYDRSPISQAIIDTYAEKGQDLSKLFTVLSDDELKKVLAGDRSPFDNKTSDEKEVVTELKAVVNSGTTGGATVVELPTSTPVTESDTPELDYDDGIPSIDL